MTILCTYSSCLSIETKKKSVAPLSTKVGHYIIIIRPFFCWELGTKLCLRTNTTSDCSTRVNGLSTFWVGTLPITFLSHLMILILQTIKFHKQQCCDSSNTPSGTNISVVGLLVLLVCCFQL